MKERTGHLTEEDLAAWTSGMLSAGEEQQLLAHAGVCDYCAELLAAHLEPCLMEPPAYLAEEILEKSRRPEVRTARTIHQTSRQMRLFLYSLKVGFALAVSLLMLSVLPGAEQVNAGPQLYFQEDPRGSLTEKLRESGNRMNRLLDDLTDWQVFTEYKEEQND